MARETSGTGRRSIGTKNHRNPNESLENIHNAGMRSAWLQMAPLCDFYQATLRLRPGYWPVPFGKRAPRNRLEFGR